MTRVRRLALGAVLLIVAVGAGVWLFWPRTTPLEAFQAYVAPCLAGHSTLEMVEADLRAAGWRPPETAAAREEALTMTRQIAYMLRRNVGSPASEALVARVMGEVAETRALEAGQILLSGPEGGHVRAEIVDGDDGPAVRCILADAAGWTLAEGAMTDILTPQFGNTFDRRLLPEHTGTVRAVLLRVVQPTDVPEPFPATWGVEILRPAGRRRTATPARRSA